MYAFYIYINATDLLVSQVLGHAWGGRVFNSGLRWGLGDDGHDTRYDALYEQGSGLFVRGVGGSTAVADAVAYNSSLPSDSRVLYCVISCHQTRVCVYYVLSVCPTRISDHFV